MTELEAGATTGTQRVRPLSPHLQIYKPMLTMMMSIVHRITGAGLYFGMLLLAWWLTAAASGPNAYANVEWFMGSLIGQLILFGYTWALLHHMLPGNDALKTPRCAKLPTLRTVTPGQQRPTAQGDK